MDASELLLSWAAGARDQEYGGGQGNVSDSHGSLQAEEDREMVLWGRGRKAGGVRGGHVCRLPAFAGRKRGGHSPRPGIPGQEPPADFPVEGDTDGASGKRSPGSDKMRVYGRAPDGGAGRAAPGIVREPGLPWPASAGTRQQGEFLCLCSEPGSCLVEL